MPPVVVRDELRTGVLVELCQVPDIAERFYAITQSRRFPNPLVREILTDPKLQVYEDEKDPLEPVSIT